jgi:hypothetical protein
VRPTIWALRLFVTEATYPVGSTKYLIIRNVNIETSIINAFIISLDGEICHGVAGGIEPSLSLHAKCVLNI